MMYRPLDRVCWIGMLTAPIFVGRVLEVRRSEFGRRECRVRADQVRQLDERDLGLHECDEDQTVFWQSQDRMSPLRQLPRLLSLSTDQLWVMGFID